MSPDGEFRVPEHDPALDDPAHRAPTRDGATAVTTSADPAPDDVARGPRAPWARRTRKTPGTAETPGTAQTPGTVETAVDTFDDVDLSTTPGPVVAAVALGVVAVPLLAVYAGLFLVRWILKPGVQPDITSTWGGEGIAGAIALVLTIVMLTIVGKATAGKGLFWFVGAELAVVAACGWLLSDDAHGGTKVSVVVGVLALAAAMLVLLPRSRRWFAAHAADRARD